jgi:hypothetical protein
LDVPLSLGMGIRNGLNLSVGLKVLES